MRNIGQERRGECYGSMKPRGLREARFRASAGGMLEPVRDGREGEFPQTCAPARRPLPLPRVANRVVAGARAFHAVYPRSARHRRVRIAAGCPKALIGVGSGSASPRICIGSGLIACLLDLSIPIGIPLRLLCLALAIGHRLTILVGGARGGGGIHAVRHCIATRSETCGFAIASVVLQILGTLLLRRLARRQGE